MRTIHAIIPTSLPSTLRVATVEAQIGGGQPVMWPTNAVEQSRRSSANGGDSNASAPDLAGTTPGPRPSPLDAVAQWLNPESSAGPCAPDADTLCIDDQPGDRRFKIEIAFSAQGGTLSGAGKAVPLSSLGIARGGLFWFFAPDNPEFLIKIINACALNNRYWIFFSAGTNVGLSVIVTDTQTGQIWTRSNPEGQAVPSAQDTAALPCS